VIRSLEQKNPDAPTKKIIALTANLSPSVRKQCFDAGMNLYIAKPFNTRSLAEGIAISQQNRSS
jgi:CheY-like chemotaxis protein